MEPQSSEGTQVTDSAWWPCRATFALSSASGSLTGPSSSPSPSTALQQRFLPAWPPSPNLRTILSSPHTQLHLPNASDSFFLDRADSPSRDLEQFKIRSGQAYYRESLSLKSRLVLEVRPSPMPDPSLFPSSLWGYISANGCFSLCCWKSKLVEIPFAHR